jgi:predicted ABC-type ATPase
MKSIINNEKSPNLYIIAGPNGSGKTTFVRKFLPDYAKCLNFVNADLIASGLSPFSPDVAAIKAGRLMLEQIYEYADKGVDFAFETTLAGKSYVKLLKDLKNKSYKIHVYFLWVSNVKLAINRIAERVKIGGHDVPKETVRRRFSRGLHNLFNLYMPLLDSWIIFDNSMDTPCVIAKEEDGILTIINDKLFKEIRRNAEVL